MIFAPFSPRVRRWGYWLIYLRRGNDGYVHAGRGLIRGHEEGKERENGHLFVGEGVDEPLDVGKKVHRHGAPGFERPLVQQEQQQVDSEGLSEGKKIWKPRQDAASNQFALVWLKKEGFKERL